MFESLTETVVPSRVTTVLGLGSGSGLGAGLGSGSGSIGFGLGAGAGSTSGGGPDFPRPAAGMNFPSQAKSPTSSMLARSPWSNGFPVARFVSTVRTPAVTERMPIPRVARGKLRTHDQRRGGQDRAEDGADDHVLQQVLVPGTTVRDIAHDRAGERRDRPDQGHGKHDRQAPGQDAGDHQRNDDNRADQADDQPDPETGVFEHIPEVARLRAAASFDGCVPGCEPGLVDPGGQPGLTGSSASVTSAVTWVFIPPR